MFILSLKKTRAEIIIFRGTKFMDVSLLRNKRYLNKDSVSLLNSGTMYLIHTEAGFGKIFVKVEHFVVSF